MRARFGVVDHAHARDRADRDAARRSRESALDSTAAVLDRATSLLADEAARRMPRHGDVARSASVAAPRAWTGARAGVDIGRRRSSSSRRRALPNRARAAWSLTDPQPCTEGPAGARRCAELARAPREDLRAVGRPPHRAGARRRRASCSTIRARSHDKPSMVQVALVARRAQDRDGSRARRRHRSSGRDRRRGEGRDLDAAGALAGLATDAVMGGAGASTRRRTATSISRAPSSRASAATPRSRAGWRSSSRRC